MDILDKLDRVLVDTTVAADVATNTGQGKIDVVGGKCPDGMVYDKAKKTCVPSMKEGYIYVFNSKKNKRIRIPDDPDIIKKYEKKGYLPEATNITKTKIIKIYKNKADGIEAHVAKVDKGFSVSLKDTDAGEFVGTSYIFPNEKDAHKKAKQIVESSVVGGSYVSGTTSNIIGSGQTRAGFTMKRNIIDLARKEPVEDEFDDPTETNILGRKALKFDKESGAYIPSIWEN